MNEKEKTGKMLVTSLHEQLLQDLRDCVFQEKYKDIHPSDKFTMLMEAATEIANACNVPIDAYRYNLGSWVIEYEEGLRRGGKLN